MTYERNVLNAANFIESNLFESLDLKLIAKQAAISPYHFHRIFRAFVCDNPMEFVKRRRLTEAAQRLTDERTRILDIAIEAGFESQEAFSRAFKRNFDASPGEFRKNGHKKHMRCRYPLDERLLTHLKEGITMEPQVKSRDAFKILGLNKDFNPDSKSEIGKLWEDFVPKLSEIKNRCSDNFYGVVCGWPTEDESEKQGRFNYAACVEVESLDEIPHGLVGRELPAGEYAVFTHKGSIQEIHSTIDYIWGSWLPKSKYEARQAPDFELYDDRFDDRTMTGELEIWVPIKEKG